MRTGHDNFTWRLTGWRSARGFTFTEIMFAVVILGIGFIMIASVFPVAIRMNAQSAEDTLSVTASERAVQNLRALLTDGKTAPTTKDDATKTGGFPTTGFLADYYPAYVTLGESYQLSSSSTDIVIPTASAAELWARTRGALTSDDGRLGLAVAYARRGTVTYNTGTPPGKTLTPDKTLRMVVVAAQMRDRPRFNDELSAVSSSGTVDQESAIKRLKDLAVPLDSNAVQFDVPNGGSTTWDKQFANQYVSWQSAASSNHGTPATLQFKRFQARFYIGEGGGPDTVEFWARADGNSPSGWSVTQAMTTGSVTALAPGTFIIVSNAGGSGTTFSPVAVKAQGDNIGALNTRSHGLVFRLGRQITQMSSNKPATFELLTGQDISSLPGTDDTSGTVGVGTAVAGKLTAPPYGDTSNTPQTVEVLALGRSLKDPTKLYDADTNPYVGPAMDVAVYSTLVYLP